MSSSIWLEHRSPKPGVAGSSPASPVYGINMNPIRAIKRFPTFLKEVRLELKKVSWSTRQELISATIVVLIGAVFLTAYILLIDTGLSKAMEMFLR